MGIINEDLERFECAIPFALAILYYYFFGSFLSVFKWWGNVDGSGLHSQLFSLVAAVTVIDNGSMRLLWDRFKVAFHCVVAEPMVNMKFDNIRLKFEPKKKKKPLVEDITCKISISGIFCCV